MQFVRRAFVLTVVQAISERRARKNVNFMSRSAPRCPVVSSFDARLRSLRGA